MGEVLEETQRHFKDRNLGRPSDLGSKKWWDSFRYWCWIKDVVFTPSGNAYDADSILGVFLAKPGGIWSPPDRAPRQIDCTDIRKGKINYSKCTRVSRSTYLHEVPYQASYLLSGPTRVAIGSSSTLRDKDYHYCVSPSHHWSMDGDYFFTLVALIVRLLNLAILSINLANFSTMKKAPHQSHWDF